MLLAHAHAFIQARHLARQKNTLVASMPDGLEAWGCDDVLWTQIPPGARRDLTRFARVGEEQQPNPGIVQGVSRRFVFAQGHVRDRGHPARYPELRRERVDEQARAEDGG